MAKTGSRKNGFGGDAGESGYESSEASEDDGDGGGEGAAGHGVDAELDEFLRGQGGALLFFGLLWLRSAADHSLTPLHRCALC